MNNEKVGKGVSALTETEQKYEALFAFSEEFARHLKEERLKLPYHLNLMDELHPNENAHSRILLRLLQFANEQGEFEIYQSLLHYIKQRQPGFGNITIDKPRMTQEEARIDLWVRDEAYAIIFENKIYNAQDQEAQLARYIEKTVELPGQKYEAEKNIFVVYLSSDGRQTPANQSWENETGVDYKPIIGDRYINLSFRADILPWLKEQVLPNVRCKDVYLKTALVQYVDYLEGRYYLRETEKQLKMKMDAFIEEKFLKNRGKDEQVKILDGKIKEMTEALDRLRDLIRGKIHDAVGAWMEQIGREYQCLVLDNYPGSIVAVEIGLIEGNPVVVLIGEEAENVYCQVEFKDLVCEISDNSEITKSLKDVLTSKNPHRIWEYTGSDYDAAYNLFCEVVDRCRKMRDGQPKTE